MKVTRKSDYGLRALFTLAKAYGREPVSIGQIAAEHRIPDPFLEKIMQELREAGLIEATLGRGGGYYLRRRPGQISIWEVVEALDGPIALVTCLDPSLRCAIEDKCPTSGIWTVINERFEHCLQELSLEDLVSSQTARTRVS